MEACINCKWHRYPDEAPNYVKGEHVCIVLPVFAMIRPPAKISTHYCGQYEKEGD